MTSYYQYGDVNPSTLVHPTQGHLEDIANWPRVYKYLSAHETHSQFVHPPAPVYQSSLPYQSGMCYYGASPYAGAGYWPNSTYYPSAGTGWPYYSPSPYSHYPYSYPSAYYSSPFPYYNAANPSHPTTTAPYSYPYQFPGLSGYSGYGGYGGHPYQNPVLPLGPVLGPSCSCPCPPLLNQATQILSANAALAAMPNAPFMWVGANQAELNMQNAIMASHFGMTPLASVTAGMPSQVVPYKPSASEQFWCKETDGSWTLREQKDMVEGKILPGNWERHTISGYFYWIRHG